MAIRYVKDFEFPSDFGFTGSAAGRKDARNHPSDADDNEFGDGSYVENPPKLAKEKAKGGPIRRAQGGATSDDYDWQDYRNSDGSKTLGGNYNMDKADANAAHEYATKKAEDARDNPGAVEGGYRRGGRTKAKGYDMGGPAQMPTGRPTGVPGMGGAPGVAPMAGPVAQAPAPMGPRPSPLAQGGGGGGPLANATMTMPVHDAARLAHGLVQAGRVGGIRQAIGNAAAARGAAMGRMAAMSPGAAGAPAAAAPQPPQQQGIPAMAHGGHHITAAQRHRLPASEFGLPAKEGYPIDTPGRARSALSRASANASPAEQAEIRRKVHARYPSIGKK